MQTRWLTRLLTVVFLLVVAVQPASAAWYAGNERSSVYGVQGTIYAPSPLPTIVGGSQSGEFSWLGATGAGASSWIQTGWSFYPFNGQSVPTPYVESLVNGVYNRSFYGTQCSGCSSDYKVDYAGSSTWYAYIAGNNKGGVGPLLPGITGQALLEVTGSTSNGANTQFKNMSYKNSSGAWKSFDQASWRENAPYHVDSKTYLYQWRSLR